MGIHLPSKHGNIAPRWFKALILRDYNREEAWFNVIIALISAASLIYSFVSDNGANGPRGLC